MPPATRTRRGGISLATVATAGFILFITFLVLGLAGRLDAGRLNQVAAATIRTEATHSGTAATPQYGATISAAHRPQAQDPKPQAQDPKSMDVNAISQVLKAAKPSVLPSTPDILEPSRIIILSQDKPRAWLYRGLLTPEECDHIIDKAQPRMHRSGVVDMKTGGSTFDDIRTSTGTFLSRKQDAVIANVESKLAAWTMIPPENGEGLQWLHVLPLHQSGGHVVYEEPKRKPKPGSTCLDKADQCEFWAERRRKVVAASVKSAVRKCGDALLFFSLKPGGELDRGSNHAGCPVIRGVKWSATKEHF
eukprot:gene3046-3871_t